MNAKLDILFVSERALWPLDQGYRVHGYNMARALRDAGLRVGIACMRDEAAEDRPWPLHRMHIDWPTANAQHVQQFRRRWAGPLGKLRERIADHQGVNVAEMAGIGALVERHQPAAVIGLGQHSPLMLRGLPRHITRIWYAADEPVYFQLSCLRRMNWRDEPLRELAYRGRAIALYALLERLFVRDLDGAIGVSEADSRLLRRIGGARRTVTIRNGVDLDYFTPAATTDAGKPRSLAFWGRMDFEPNVDAVCWFAQYVWPTLKARHPDATWTIAGKLPTPRVLALNAIDGIDVVGEVPDVRPIAHGAAVTILPMRCGGGIKNKLLEAAAMALPIVASPRAVRGLTFEPDARPASVCGNAPQWIDMVDRLWRDHAQAERMRLAARRWVERHHTWHRAAMQLVDFLRELGCENMKICARDETRSAFMPKSFAA